MQISVTYRLSSTKDGLYAYALHVSANFGGPLGDSDGVPKPANVFVFRRSTPTMNPFGHTDMEVNDEFFNVATPVDMYDIPEKNPDIERGMPYFRDSEMDLWFRNLEDVTRAKREIDADVAALARLWDNLNNPEDYQLEETITHE